MTTKRELYFELDDKQYDACKHILPTMRGAKETAQSKNYAHRLPRPGYETVIRYFILEYPIRDFNGHTFTRHPVLINVVLFNNSSKFGIKIFKTILSHSEIESGHLSHLEYISCD